LDDHHIVPASWGKKHLKTGVINSILNRTPLTADTNRHVINDRPPNEYLAEMIAQNGRDAVQTILETHFISSTALDILLREPFGPDDYEAFISERQRTFQEAIESLLIKDQLYLAPHLRQLDADVERTELRIRELVRAKLSDNVSAVPPHVVQKVTERVVRAMKKNAAMDAERYSGLAGMLEFFDFRELQDTIGAKTLWPTFESVFGSKEALALKFDQLAELRNCIRHSRTVSDITRKEGEAALLWFHTVLAKSSGVGTAA
jgi:hypothetical protein